MGNWRARIKRFTEKPLWVHSTSSKHYFIGIPVISQSFIQDMFLPSMLLRKEAQVADPVTRPTCAGLRRIVWTWKAVPACISPGPQTSISTQCQSVTLNSRQANQNHWVYNCRRQIVQKNSDFGWLTTYISLKWEDTINLSLWDMYCIDRHLMDPEQLR